MGSDWRNLAVEVSGRRRASARRACAQVWSDCRVPAKGDGERASELGLGHYVRRTRRGGRAVGRRTSD